MTELIPVELRRGTRDHALWNRGYYEGTISQIVSPTPVPLENWEFGLRSIDAELRRYEEHPAPKAPPGWYRDGARDRWWDGNQWTEGYR